MEFFRIKKDIPFMRHALVFNIISLVTFLAAVFFLATKGLHLSIEFTGGTLVEVGYTQSADIEKIRKQLDADGFVDTQVQNFGSSRDVLIRLALRGDVKQAALVSRVFEALCAAESGTVATQQITSDKGEAISKPVCSAGGAEPVQLKRSEFVGPQVGSELARDGAYALAATIAGIMLYLAIRFEWKFSVAAIIANLHDVIIILGFFALFAVKTALHQAPTGRLAQTLHPWLFSGLYLDELFTRLTFRLWPPHLAPKAPATERRTTTASLANGARV